MRDREDRKLIEQVAKEQGVSYAVAESVINHSLKYVSTTIAAGKFEGVSLPGLGTFWVKQQRLQYYERIHRAGGSSSDSSGDETNPRVQEDN